MEEDLHALYVPLPKAPNNVEAALSPYNNVAAPSFINGAVQETTFTPNANINFDGGIRGPSNHGHNGADYRGDTLGSITARGIGYHQSLSTALPLQYSSGVYANDYADPGVYPPNNGTAIGMAHGSSGYATNATVLGAGLTGSTSTVSSSLPASTTGSAGSHYLHYGNGVYPTGYSNVNSSPSENAIATAIGMDQVSNGYTTNGTALGAPATGPTATMSNTFSHSTRGSVGDQYLQQVDGVYPTTAYTNSSSYASNTTTSTAISIAHGSNNHATNSAGLAAPSAGTTPTLSNALAPSIPGSAAEPNGRPRWACTGCLETFSRQADMVRHARKHSGVLLYQCPVANCRYKGSYRLDKLEQHKRNCH